MPRAAPVISADLPSSRMADRQAGGVETVDPVGERGEIDGVAVADRHVAAGADVDGAELARVDVDEGVGAEVLGDADRAGPGALGRGGGDRDVLGADADGVGAVLRRL